MQRESRPYLINGNIYTVNDNFDKATAFAIRNGKFVCISNDNDILENIQAIISLTLKAKVFIRDSLTDIVILPDTEKTKCVMPIYATVIHLMRLSSA